MTFKTYFCLLFSLGFISIPTSLAQTENLKQLLEKGKANYPFLKAKESELFSAAEKIDAAQTGYLPDLTIGHQYTYGTGNNVEGAFLPNGGTALSPSGGI